METNKKIRITRYAFIFEEGTVTSHELREIEAFYGTFPAKLVDKENAFRKNTTNPYGFIIPENVAWLKEAIPGFEALGFEVEVDKE